MIGINNKAVLKSYSYGPITVRPSHRKKEKGNVIFFVVTIDHLTTDVIARTALSSGRTKLQESVTLTLLLPGGGAKCPLHMLFDAMWSVRKIQS